MQRERRQDYATDLAVWAVLCVPVILKAAPTDVGSWIRAAVGTGALAAAVLVHRAWPLAALAIAIALSLSASRELYTVSFSPSLITFGFFAGRRLARAQPALLCFGGLAGTGLVLALISNGSLWPWFTYVATLLFAVVVPWLVGRYARQYAQLIRTGWQLADRMEQEQRATADRERMRERSRIAGDMHDSLGHELSLIAVRAAALEVDRSLDGEQQAAAGELRQAAADATARLRDIIGILRAGDSAPMAPSDETVAELVDRARSSGMAVEVVRSGPPTALPRMVERAVHRVAQEALTNAAKHAPGAQVRICLSVSEDMTLTVRVRNGPQAEGHRLPGMASGGMGLVGLDERVRLAGGSLMYGPATGGGFELVARLPVHERQWLDELDEEVAPSGSVGADRSTSAARELARARQRVRRGLVQAIVTPVAVLMVVGALMLTFQMYMQSRTVLGRDQYDLLKVGDGRADVETRLPGHTLDSEPEGLSPEPAGADGCSYYRTRKFDVTPVYRLCFKDDRLVSKGIATDVPDEESRRRGR